MVEFITIKCPFCEKEWFKEKIDKYCSNCFCCTGCERYVCPNCDNVIEIIPVKKIDTNHSKK